MEEPRRERPPLNVLMLELSLCIRGPLFRTMKFQLSVCLSYHPQRIQDCTMYRVHLRFVLPCRKPIHGKRAEVNTSRPTQTLCRHLGHKASQSVWARTRSPTSLITIAVAALQPKRIHTIVTYIVSHSLPSVSPPASVIILVVAVRRPCMPPSFHSTLPILEVLFEYHNCVLQSIQEDTNFDIPQVVVDFVYYKIEDATGVW